MQIQSREIPTCNPDILEVGIHAQSKIAGQSPGCGRPCEQLDIRLIFNREADNHWYLKRLIMNLETAHSIPEGSLTSL